MSGRMGAPVFRFALPNAFVQATSPFLMQDTTAPGTRYFASRPGMRSSSARPKVSSALHEAWREIPRTRMKAHRGAKVFGADITLSVPMAVSKANNKLVLYF